MCLPFLCGGDDPVKNSEVRPPARHPREGPNDGDGGHKPSPPPHAGGAVNGNGGAAPAPATSPDTEVQAPTYGDKQISRPKEGAAGKPPTVVPAANHPQAPTGDEAKKGHGGGGAVGRRNGISSTVLTAPPPVGPMAAPATTVKDAPPAAAAATNDVHGDADEQHPGYGDHGEVDDRKPRRRSWL
ncbi:hypothetical protein OsI_22759 [Oryza sativa Indica Group]|uniref:Uncharacterized protein n=1 Tax=Oryza sativa subsp. indica TaxID=39946 RepID=A2YCC2_ORYSI|nr:hypothetical protein OsI_22759 [Oryza sativa Indica Group]